MVLFPARVYRHVNIGGVDTENRMAVTLYWDRAVVKWAEERDPVLMNNGPHWDKPSAQKEHDLQVTPMPPMPPAPPAWPTGTYTEY